MKFFLLPLCYCFISISICGTNTQIIMRKSRPPNYYMNVRSSNTTTQPAYGEKAVNKIIQNRINHLALFMDKMLSKCSTREGNVVFAPINIVKTLSTVMLGAAGRTEKELYTAIGENLMGRPLNKVTAELSDREVDYMNNEINETSLFEFHQSMGRLLRHIGAYPGVVKGSNIDIAGGVFIQSDYPVKQTFVDQATNIYRTEVYNLNFTGDGYNSANFINQWITKKTHGRIKDVVAPPINPLTRVIIAGALYFNGDWEYPFMEKITKWQPFYLGAEGKYGKEGNILVEMMVNQAKIPVYENKALGFQAIGMPYKGGDVIMYVVLPKLKISLKQLMCQLKPEDIDTIINKSTLAEAFYVIPKMKLDYEVNLRDTLQQLNVKTMFDPQTANFSNLAEGVYVTDILHKVNVELNERGTIAAATTVVSMNRGGYVNFRADRPFFFFIYNVKVGIMTFWGSVKKPVPFKTNLNSK